MTEYDGDSLHRRLVKRPPPRKELTDWQIIKLYEVFSEEVGRSSFMSPSPLVIEGFRLWLGAQTEDIEAITAYQEEMLTEYKKQENKR